MKRILRTNLSHRPGTMLLWLLAPLLYLFLYVPIAIVIVYSFNNTRFGAKWAGFTTQWYPALWQNAQALAAAKNTLLLGVSSTVIATLLGTLLGYGLGRYRFPGRRWFAQLLYIPVFLPDIILAVALLLFYSLVHAWLGIFEPGLWTMIIGHVTFQVPFVAIVIRSRLAGLDPSLEEAARDLGASEWQAFAHVTLPLMLPGIVAGAMLAFTLSLDDFVVSFFTSGPGATTLPIYIYASVKRGITPDVNALSTLMVLASVLAASGLMLLKRRQDLRP